MGFNLIYWTPMCGKYFLEGSILEKCGKIWKNGRFSGRLWPDWGNTTWAAMAGLGSIGLSKAELIDIAKKKATRSDNVNQNYVVVEIA